MTKSSLPAKKPLSVAFYMHDLSGGGVERMRLALMAVLQSRGVDVTLVVTAKQGRLVQDLPSNLAVVELRVSRTCLAIPKLAAFLRTRQPDILVSSLDHNNIAAMLAQRMSGSPTQLVICQHNALSRESTLGWKYRLVPLAFRLLKHIADGIVAVSHGVADDLADTAHIPRQKISVIYNPVIDEGFFERAAGAAPHPWLGVKDHPVFVFVGRLTAQKDVLSLLAAVQIILRKRIIRLILVGEGEEEHALRRYACEAGIAHAVAFAGFQANPLPWMRHADALVSSSRYEGLGNVIVEALACGTAVISTDCPHGPAELLQNGRLGRLVPVGDVAALAEAIASYDERQIDPGQLRAHAENFSAVACADAHLDLFETIMSKRRKVVHALGMDLSPLRTNEVVELIVGETMTGGVRLVVTPNLDHVRRLRCPSFAAAYAAAYLVCPDGLPVLVYGRLRGLRLPGRVTGCDVFSRLIRHDGLFRHRLCLIVESRSTSEAAHRWARSLGLADRVDIAVAPLGLDASELAQAALAQRICRTEPTILVMTLGAPVSEVFVHRYRQALPPCWALCVGQALRVELALARRAPAFWQALGLEWLWRLGHEPRRLVGRYARSLAWFPVAVWRDLYRHERRQGS